MKIYLAGKIAKNDWRGSFVPGLEGYGNLDEPTLVWPTLPTIADGIEYVGPYFAAGCDHGCSHGAATHGQGERGSYCGGAYPSLSRRQIAQNCFNAIRACDLFFAWLPLEYYQQDGYEFSRATSAFGTLVELGYARALGKRILVGTDTTDHSDCTGGHGCCCGHNELWFARESATWLRVSTSGPMPLLTGVVADFARVHLQRDKLESPLETAFFDAWVQAKPPELAGLTVQHKVHANGKNYRLDFALPDRKIAFEMDGRTYHDTDVAFIRDRRRDLDLELAGWRVHRFDGDLIRANPANVVAIAAKLAGAAA